MNKKKINFVITDLDDTIWDWLTMWYSSFKPYLDDIAREFGIDEGTLKADFKQLHEKYGTSEASYIYNELTSLTDEQKAIIDNHNASDSIMHRYNSSKKHSLRLYESVYETLQHIKSKGALLVGFTESNDFFTRYRLTHLRLDGIFDAIYTPKGYELPESVKRRYDDEFWEVSKTKISHLKQDFRKPDEHILNEIIADYSGNKESTIYIGDKLHKDIYMAQQANVVSVHAEYGHMISTREYKLLQDVTHWTLADVERERNFREEMKLMQIPDPNYVLRTHYSELLNYFDFESFTQKT